MTLEDAKRASFVAGIYNGRRVYVQRAVPFIGFNIGYWNDHYRDRPFFHERNKWWKDHDGDNSDHNSGDWKKQSEEPQPIQFPRHKKWDNGNDSLGGQGTEMQGPGPDDGKQGIKHNRDHECGPQSDNPKCAQMNQ